MDKLKVLSLFSGIGAPEKALTNLGIDYELINYCEIDKYASCAYAAIHNVSEDKNLGDITKAKLNKIEIDMMTWAFPCQDISIAGNQKGIIQGETKSGLYYEGLKFLKEIKPKYSIIENVKNLTGKKFKFVFEKILYDLSNAGYKNYWQILNAKDYGIPQSRERVFIVSIRSDINQNFEFPKPFDNGLRLKDLLEKEVDEKYYLEKEKVDKLLEELKDRVINNENDTICVGRVEGVNGHDYLRRVYSVEGVSPTIPTCCGGNHEPKVYLSCFLRTRNYMGQPQQLEIRKDEISNTITTVQKDALIIEDFYKNRDIREYKEYSPTLRADRQGLKVIGEDTSVIRKLTPLECWRLMGFSDKDFYKVKNVLNNKFYKGKDRSDSQLYKMAGNSIVVDVLEEIYKGLLPQYIVFGNNIIPQDVVSQ